MSVRQLVSSIAVYMRQFPCKMTCHRHPVLSNGFMECSPTQPVARFVYSALQMSTRRSSIVKSMTESSPTKGEKLVRRLSHILACLHQRDAIDKDQLAVAPSVSVRTIERDLHESERLIGIAECSKQGHWRLVRHSRSRVPARHLYDYARMTGTENLFPDRSLSGGADRSSGRCASERSRRWRGRRTLENSRKSAH